VKSANVVQCTECRQPIASSEDIGFVCFKVPGTEGYHYFHCRFRGSDCWEAYLKAHRYRTGARKA
jgi:hypothetical protein